MGELIPILCWASIVSVILIGAVILNQRENVLDFWDRNRK
jgi:hypothetical protein